MARAFTLIELLVVITIVVVLLALLAPALDRAIEMTERTLCATNQHVISLAVTQYGLQNRRALFICRGREVMLAVDPLGNKSHIATDQDALVDWPAAMASVGLAGEKQTVPVDRYAAADPGGYVNNVPGKMWNCPGRKGWESYWAYNPVLAANGGADLHNMFLGYMYYGGLSRWRAEPLRSVNNNPPTPKRITDPGDRTLVSDVIARVNGIWGNPEFQNGGSPPHTDGEIFPAGSNHAFLDGSVEWVGVERLMMLHTWNNRGDIQRYFFWQRDAGGWDYGDRKTDQFWATANR